MSVNKYLPHILVLPEDDANRQLANGFLLDDSLVTCRIQVLAEAGGWREVLNQFETDYMAPMRRWPERRMVLLFDLDDDAERLGDARARIPAELKDRVFIIGARSEPEALRQARLGSYEEIGRAAARDCRQGTDVIWGHHLLEHNRAEVDRMREQLRPILFPL